MTGVNYIGLRAVYDPREQAAAQGEVRYAFPEGYVSLINNNGRLGALVTGQQEAIPVEEYRVFSCAKDAFEWVAQKGA